jgi:Protein of unknown function (DUF3293)
LGKVRGNPDRIIHATPVLFAHGLQDAVAHISPLAAGAPASRRVIVAAGGAMFAATRRFRAAYLATHYLVFVPEGTLIVRIGQRSAMLDRLMAGRGARTAACVTAFNPGSRRRGRGANLAAHRALLAHVRRRGWRHLLAEGRDPAGAWPGEASLLVFGLGPAAARQLGRRFRQNAILLIRRGRPPELAALR